ncbi:MAG: hypothetical protein JNK11_03370 [Alphaproteobacteria bacterium]|nr:hypothetical protein [Alphaproteobacteria bacterium]
MRYLGGLRGTGTLSCGDVTLARADYDFEGYLNKPGQMSCSGEIRVPPQLLNEVFGRRDLFLLTEDGRRLSLRFSGKRADATSDAAHVDVAGDLPAATAWRH